MSIQFAFASFQPTLTVPAHDQDGAYTVTWNGMASANKELKENGGRVYYGTATTRTFSGKGSGAYDYRVHSCDRIYVNSVVGWVTSCGWSQTKTLTVTRTPGIPASISTPSPSSNGNYTISWGSASGANRYRLDEQVKSGGSWGNWVQVYAGSGTSKAFSGKPVNGRYRYRIRAYYTLNGFNSSNSGARVSGEIFVPPSPPGRPNLTLAGSDTDGAYPVTWSVPSGVVDSYTLEEKTGSGAWQAIQTSAATSRSVSGKANQIYSYRVKACNAGGCGSYSATKTLTVVRTPAAPGPVSLSPASLGCSGNATLAWGAAAGGNRYQVRERRRLSGGNWAAWNSLTSAHTSTSYGRSGAAAGYDYQYAVRARYYLNNFHSPWSAYVYSNTIRKPYCVPGSPGTPALSTTTPLTTSDYTVSWTAATSGTVSSYELQEQFNGGSWGTAQQTAALNRTFSNRAYGNYCYRVRSRNVDEVSGFTTSRCVTVRYPLPTAGISLSGATQTGTHQYNSGWQGEYTVGWTAGGQALTSVALEDANGATLRDIGTATLTGSQAYDQLDNTGPGDDTFTYRIKVCNPEGCTTSPTITVAVKPYPIPLPPGNFQADSATSVDNQYSLSWTAPQESVTWYLLERDGQIEQLPASQLSRSYSDGVAGQTYSHRIKACFNDILPQHCSNFTAARTVYFIYPVPGVPGAPGVSATAPLTTESYTVAWDAATGAVQSYQLQTRINGGSWTTLQDTPARTATVNNPARGSHCYRVRARNADNNSAYTAGTCVTVSHPLPGVPGALQAVSDTTDPNAFTLSWGAAGGVVDTYTVERRAGSGAWAVLSSVTAPTVALSYSADSDYLYRVKACNIDGCSPYTAALDIDVIDPPAPPPGPAAAPTVPATAVSDAIGATAGRFRVGESGAATYKVPLVTPAGTAGVTPQLSLDYSSQGDNGVAGLGWSIGGLSAITRCRPTLAQDGAARPVSWSDADRFCLDGQRLMVAAGHSYGAIGATYRTEIDSFVTVTAHGGTAGHPDYFTVIRKDGSISHYGDSTDARQTTGDGSYIFTWAQNRFADSAGNAIDYLYAGDGGHRISEIRYAYGDGGNHNASVTFSYADGRADPVGGYVAGYAFMLDKRLSQIAVSNGANTVRTYTLTYQAVSGGINKLSRLASLQECAGTCLPATEFTWLPEVAGFAASTGSRDLGARVYGYKPADINGDGNQDLVLMTVLAHSNGDTDYQLRYMIADATGALGFASFVSGSPPTNTPGPVFHEDLNETVKFAIIDYNGDGRQDVMVYNKRGGLWRVHLSAPQTGGGWKLQAGSIDAGLPADAEDISFIDINGDGLADAVDSDQGVYPLQRDTSQALTSSTPYKFGPKQPLSWQGVTPLVPTLATHRLERNLGPVGDFNGDGRVDVVALDFMEQWHCNSISGCISAGAEKNVYVLAYDGQALVNQGLLEAPGGKVEDLADVQVADFNRDGLSDLLFAVDDRYYAQLSLGEGFATPVDLGFFPSYQRPAPVDYNRDGYADLGWYNHATSGLKVRLWNPQIGGFDGAMDVAGVSGVNGDNNDSHLFLDMNGDGAADYVHINGTANNQSNTITTYPAHPHDGFMITRIRNGLGAETDIAYGTLTHSGHYERVEVAGTTSTGTIRVPIGGGIGGSYEVPYIHTDFGEFYAALNGPWPLPADSHTFGKDQPVLEFMAPVPVVTRVTSTAPAAGGSPGAVDATAKSGISYYYGEAKIQAAGRGMLGFQKVMSVDDQTGVQTVTTFRQDFPFIGRPLSTEVYTADNVLLSRADNTWQLVGWDGTGAMPDAPYRPYIATAVEQTYPTVTDPGSPGQLTVGSEPMQTVTTTKDYDVHGNPAQIEVVTSGGGDTMTKTTVNQYGDGLSLDLHGHTFSYAALGRLSRTQVTTTRGSDSRTRTAAFTYYQTGPQTGLLHTEVIEPDKPAYTLTTGYDYDAFGNQIKATQSAGGVVSRHSETAYDGLGRYVSQRKNAYGQVTEQVDEASRDPLGQPTSITDINGATAFYTYGALGRQVQQYTQTGAWRRTLLGPCDASCPASGRYIATTVQGGGAETRLVIDALGRTVREARRHFDGSWTYVDTEYDTLGRVRRTSEPHGGTALYWTEVSYDLLGRVVQTKLPGIATPVTVSYNGLTTVTTNPKGQTKTEIKNPLGELVEVQDSIDGRVTYDYDAEGNLRTVNTLGNGDVAASAIHMCYDDLGRKIAMRDPDKGGYLAGAGDSCPASTTQPVTGWWVYDYNAFGELTQQIDAKGQIRTLGYDKLGRQVARVDRRADNSTEGDTTWSYNNGTGGTGRGALIGVTDAVSGYLKLIDHDAYGRVSETTTNLGGSDNHYERITYDQYGRTFQVFDAAGDGSWQNHAIQHSYNNVGYLQSVKNAGRANGVQTVYYTVIEMDRRGNVTESLGGNGVTHTQSYNPATGRLETLRAGLLPGLGDVQDHSYSWDALGNLLSRDDRSGNKTLDESFSYDDLNRLTGAQVTGRAAQSVTYDSLGNITTKTGIGAYTYGGAGPHAVTATADGASYTYDANGNMTGDGDRSLTYTTFDKPDWISKGAHTTTFKYGPDRRRYQRTDTNATGTTVTRYFGAVEKITHPDGSGTVKRYLPGGALITLELDNAGMKTGEMTQYLYKDHLGSLDVITDAVGLIDQDGNGTDLVFSFDAWGQRRSAADWSVLSQATLTGFVPAVIDVLPTRRGFTMHEHIDEVGLIHMNGRVYDARLGRFLQADPFIQAPADTQMYNRYSYVRNNPLNATDPSGYFLSLIATAVVFAAEGYVVTTAVMVTAGISAFAETLIYGGDLGSAIVNGVSATAFTALGGSELSSVAGFAGTATRVLTFGTVGGITAMFQGGRFGHGFASAGLGGIAGGWLGGVLAPYTGEAAGRIIGAAVVGGTISDATGGKFANGAGYAAFAVAVQAGVRELHGYTGEDIIRQVDEDVKNAGPGVTFSQGRFVAKKLDGSKLSVDEVKQVQKALDQIAKSDAGKSLLDQAVKNKIKVNILLNDKGMLASTMSLGSRSQVVYLDADFIENKLRIRDSITEKFVKPSFARVLAHELGHALGLRRDDWMPNYVGEGSFQDNIRLENAIMRPIDGIERTCQECVRILP